MCTWAKSNDLIDFIWSRSSTFPTLVQSTGSLYILGTLVLTQVFVLKKLFKEKREHFLQIEGTPNLPTVYQLHSGLVLQFA